MTKPWLVPAAALAASLALACGSSPTSPSATALPVAADEAAVAEASAATRSGLPPRPTSVCDVKAIMLAAKPAAERRAWHVVATFKGDASGCPAVGWAVFPSAPLSVGDDANSAVVFDSSSIKTGRVRVTATLRTGTLRLSDTIQLSFPRGVN